MSNQWMDYTTFFLAGALPLLAVLIGYGGLRIFKAAPRTGTERREKAPHEAGAIVRSSRVNLRYFMALNVAVLLLAMALLLIPPVISMKQASGKSVAPLVMILVVSSFSFFGLVYAVTKGDLGWIRAHRAADKAGEQQ